ncbi:MAG: hypothetical protein JNM88_08250 [Chitinophagaceae bacterium]|nr:hypothetical protein [Chitinophagaceae bacterium]
MKRTSILSVTAILALAITFTSCKPSRVWATKKKEPKEYREKETYSRPAPPPPPRYSYVSLIITPSPGFVMKQNPGNGRFYHRSHDGFLYWKGYDNRFYLDRSHLNRVSYSKGEYDEWKRYSRASN